MLKQKIISFARKSLPDKINALQNLLCGLKGVLYYRRVFASFGKGSLLFKPMLLSNPQFMHIGSNVVIRAGARMEAIMIDPENPPELRIGNNVNIEQDVHIVCMGKVHIADNVSITARCSLLGGSHPFFDIHDPVKIGYRLSGAKSVIEIGEGSFLGIGTVVAPNVKIGKHVVVGSNSVVKKNLPDYSVAEGDPATVGLKYDFDKGAWATLAKR